MDSTVEDDILLLYGKGDWQGILDHCNRNRFLPWIWPNRENLNFIGQWVRERGSNSVVSIGCGSGLLEWMLQMATGLEVIGVEVEGIWWKSKYSCGSFIPLLLVHNPAEGKLSMSTKHKVLLFCYFNNLAAFLGYVENFEGNCLIVIGPGPGRGTYTIPEPFQLPAEVLKCWQLVDSQELRSSKDFIAVYVKIEK